MMRGPNGKVRASHSVSTKALLATTKALDSARAELANVHPILGLISDLRHNHNFSPYAKATGLSGWMKHLAEELDELQAELDSLEESAEDYRDKQSRFASELGDVFWNCITVALAFESLSGISLESVVSSARAKLRSRKPWLFSESVANGDFSGLPSSAAEEAKMYKAKKEELLKRGKNHES